MALKPRFLTSTFSIALLFIGTSLLHAESNCRTESYVSPQGKSFHAVCVKTNSQTETTKKHLLMIDTSASQLGEYRKHSFAVAAEILKNLPADHEVAIWAVDLKTHPMTDGFVLCSDNAVSQALATIKNRFPAGSTNMKVALENAIQFLPANQPSSIIYVGDGISSNNVLLPNETRNLISSLNAKRISVHSHAVGPKTDMQLLGILALNTGGVTISDALSKKSSDVAPAVAKQLANASTKTPWYPNTLEFSGMGNASILPNKALPVRSDRDTVYLIQGSLNSNSALKLSSNSEMKSWKITDKNINDANVFLPALWNRAAKDNGLSQPLAGESMIRIVRNSFGREVTTLLAKAEKAVITRNFSEAKLLATQVQKVDPNNVQAKVIQSVSKRMMLQPVSFIQNETLNSDDDTANLENRAKAPTKEQANPISRYEALRRVATQRLQLQVSRSIEQAREIVRLEPSQALVVLTQALETVRNANDIDETVQKSLEKRVQLEIIDVNAKRDVLEKNNIRAQEQLAAIQAKKALVEEMLLVDERLNQLIEQVRALMKDGRQGNDAAYEQAEAVGRAAVDLRPGNGPATAAVFNAEAAGQLNDAFRLRSIRADRFLATLTQVELSHVPFPDEPPLRYPPAPVWRELTEIRKQWASVDLKKHSPAEIRIEEALETETQFDYENESLKHVLETIAERHNITIYPKEDILEEEGILLDDPVSLVLSGITLRVGLKLLLEKQGLTWIIEDGMMKITTQTDADSKLETRVYPVADLVIQPTAQGGGLGGQQGGFGGGQGGFGGGQGGFGGQQGGQGGFFSIPAASVESLKMKKKAF